MPVLDEAVVTGRLRYRNCQPQPTAPKPASIQEVASRTLARQIREVPPELAHTADVKKPETSSGFLNWWWSTTDISTDYLQVRREFYTNEGSVRPRRDICLSR